MVIFFFFYNNMIINFYYYFLKKNTNATNIYLISIIKTFKIILGLDSNMKFKLKDLLDAQIAGVLTRIEEERASLNSDSEFNHHMK